MQAIGLVGRRPECWRLHRRWYKVLLVGCEEWMLFVVLPSHSSPVGCWLRYRHGCNGPPLLPDASPVVSLKGHTVGTQGVISWWPSDHPLTLKPNVFCRRVADTKARTGMDDSSEERANGAVGGLPRETRND